MRQQEQIEQCYRQASRVKGEALERGRKRQEKNSTLMLNVLESIGWGKEGGGDGDEQTAEWLTSSLVL